jgi:hypothetical protein
MPMRVPFASYSPDLPSFGNQGMQLVRNVIPHAGGFRPFPGLSTYSDALAARCQGAVFTTDEGGDVFGFAGDATKLYEMSGGTTEWNDVSKVGGYNTPVEDGWSFAVVGINVLASNFADPIQSYVLGSSAIFAHLGGSPPKAKYLAVIRNFTVAAFLDQGGNVFPQRLQWSAIGNPASWPTPGTDAARIVQADQQDLLGDGGDIHGIVGGLSGADGAVILQRELHRMLYVQPPLVFAFDRVEGGRGTPAAGSIAQIGGTIFYLGEDGFYRFDGQSSVPIGGSRVDRTFFANVDAAHYHRVTAAVDPVNKIVLWSYPSGAATDGAPDRLLTYNWEINEWADGALDLQYLVRSMTFGVDLDTDLNADEVGIDDDDWPSLDSSFWVGGRPGLAGFNSSGELAFFTGSPLAATLDTGEFELSTGRAALINRIRPLIDTAGNAPGITARVQSRYRLSDALSTGQAYIPTSNGHCHARSRGRYHRIRVEIDAGTPWEFAQGVDVDGMLMEGS